jgi:5-hydroxyisourate hydrolase
MGALTTHVLDLVHGGAATGVRVDLARLEGGAYRPMKTLVTNATGRTDAPLLAGAAMAAGRYELVFHIGDYFAARGVALAAPRFIDRVPVRFAIASPEAAYHVPLLAAPWGYSTYRGS